MNDDSRKAMFALKKKLGYKNSLPYNHKTEVNARINHNRNVNNDHLDIKTSHEQKEREADRFVKSQHWRDTHNG